MKQYDKERLYDAIIVGGGPAGLTAAIYLARARYRVLVLEKEQIGGQITITDEVVNYPGIERTSGRELAETMHRQAENFGAEFRFVKVIGIGADGDVKTVMTDAGEYYGIGILLATGARPRILGFVGETEHRGHGVAYCATCDGEFFTGCDIYVIGGGYAAAEESVFLTRYAKSVTILIREDDFTCAAAVAEPARRHEKITILTNTVVEEVGGENRVDYIRYRNTKTGEVTERHSNEPMGVFVFAGYVPESDFVRDILSLDENGYIETDKSTVAGIYAAGDVCVKPLRQVITAAGDGALAATSLERYISATREKCGIVVMKPTDRKNAKNDTGISGEIFSDDMAGELRALFEKMPKRMSLLLDLGNGAESDELEKYVRALASVTDKIDVRVNRDASPNTEPPCVRICDEDGTEFGISFHGIPTGHEFTPFVLGIYAASGGASPLDTETKKEIDNVKKSISVKIFVSLSCTMCPDTVISAGRIAAESPYVTLNVYDIRYFEELKKKYSIMSVPCIVINDDTVSFGKKNIGEIVKLIKKE